jgi:hypothetical protein
MIGVIKKKRKRYKNEGTVRTTSLVTAQKAVLPAFFCTDPPAIFDLILNMFDDSEL